ncbi:hypothetical protein C3L33_17026, partial [Rhododendron williamsianum]
MKAEKSVGTQLFGHAKKEPAAAKDGAPKASGSSKSGSKKAAPKTSLEPKKKVSPLIRLTKACKEWKISSEALTYMMPKTGHLRKGSYAKIFL